MLKKKKVPTMASLKKENQTKNEICTTHIPKTIGKIFLDEEVCPMEKVCSYVHGEEKSLTPHCPNFSAIQT